jgi:hypothetical protein
VDCSEEISRSFVVVRGDCAELLEFTEEIFDPCTGAGRIRAVSGVGRVNGQQTTGSTRQQEAFHGDLPSDGAVHRGKDIIRHSPDFQ